MNESFMLPAPIEYSDVLSGESSEDDEDYEGEASDEEISSVYADWINELEREDLKMLAMLMYDNYRKRFGLLKTSAAKEVALCLGMDEKTVRLWRKNFLENSGSFTVDGRGKYARSKVLDDKEYRDLALEWVHTHAYVKGKPNMTATYFFTWINTSLLPKVAEHHPSAPTKISVCTASRWLHSLGFEKVSSKKGIESLLLRYNYKGFFIPKFHCELNPIERVWAHSKKYTRAHCDYSFNGLEGTVTPALNSVTLDLIRKFFRKMRDYMTAYREGLVAGPELERLSKCTSRTVKYMKVIVDITCQLTVISKNCFTTFLYMSC